MRFFVLFLTRSSGCYAALLLAPAEGLWPSATWEGPSGPPNDFLYSEWANLGGVSFLTFCDFKFFFQFLDFKGSFLSLIFEF